MLSALQTIFAAIGMVVTVLSWAGALEVIPSSEYQQLKAQQTTTDRVLEKKLYLSCVKRAETIKDTTAWGAAVKDCRELARRGSAL